MRERKGLLVWLAEALQGYADQERKLRPQDQAAGQPGRLVRLLRWLTPNGGTLLLVAALILTQRVWAGSLFSSAATGPSATTVNYQGRLADSGGVPLDGTYGMTFALWDASTEGNLVWGP